MRDELEAPFLDDWLHETEVTPPDPRVGARRVATRLPHTRQVGRWLPFPVLHRKVQSSTASDTAELQPSPGTATNGRAPTVIGRTHSMFNPVAAITAGVLVFAIGGVMLVVQPFEQQGAMPGAETEQQAALVTGTMVRHYPSGGTHEETLGADGNAVQVRFAGATGTIETTDPRLTGDVTYDGTMDFVPVPQLDPPRAELSWATVAIRNQAGLWEGRTTCVPSVTTSGYEDPCFYELDGKEAYEGLSAVLLKHERLEIDGDGEDEVFVVDGLIFTGDLPPDR